MKTEYEPKKYSDGWYITFWCTGQNRRIKISEAYKLKSECELDIETLIANRK